MIAGQTETVEYTPCYAYIIHTYCAIKTKKVIITTTKLTILYNLQEIAPSDDPEQLPILLDSSSELCSALHSHLKAYVICIVTCSFTSFKHHSKDTF